MSRLSTKIRALQRAIANFGASARDASAIFSALNSHNGAQGAFATRYIHRHVSEAVSDVQHSRSQYLQDLFVLAELNMKRGGYFVEFGATDGIEISNTYLLETRYGWRGILAEPARSWHEALHRNRNCAIDRRCVWDRSGLELEFCEPEEAEYSTLTGFVDADMHAAVRREGSRYNVETVSLNDLLEQHDAPRCIDYLSIDTEGSEFAILDAFDFDRHDVRVITCEHNFMPQREKIRELLTSNGFTRTLTQWSNVDDWYVRH